MADLPNVFLQTMEALLGEEYEPFLAGFDAGRQFGLRVNTSKISLEEFERIAPFHLTPIPWIPNGYFYEEADGPARHPFYSAGLYYLQEPSAMTPASRLPVYPGDYVLDLCAAPGGKATALGAKLKGRGLLVANDINTARGKALLRNLELFGIPNAFVTNEPPYMLSEKFPVFFDKIMVDAPCSGEGMFRKNPAVIEAWQEKGPEYFSKIQQEIIVNGADMLKENGYLFYSTCTFSPAENERTITHLLSERPEMEVVPMEEYEGFAEGLTRFQGEKFHESCRLCRRIWPHKMSGEGHFMALLHKKGRIESRQSGQVGIFEENQNSVRLDSEGSKKSASPRFWWENISKLNKEQKQALADFFVHVHWNLQPENVDVRGDKVYYVPSRSYEGLGIHFLRNGIYLGDLKKKRFEPSQPFALALTKESFDQMLDFPENDERLIRYLRGETLLVEDLLEEKNQQENLQKSPEENSEENQKENQSENGKQKLEINRKKGKNKKQEKRENETKRNGWYLVLVCGYPLGFGKLSGTTLKNKYPSGWRKN